MDKFIGLLAISAFVLAMPFSSKEETSTGPMVEEFSLNGWQFQLVESAVARARFKIPNIAEYKIYFLREGTKYTVMFRDPNAPDGLGGGSDYQPILLSLMRIIRSFGAHTIAER